jgi:hypothetical protein
MLQMAAERRAMRRAVRTQCQVVDSAEFRLLGHRVFDLSPRGMLVACDRNTRVGDDVLVSFRAPGLEELWFDAEAVVARVIGGQRWSDAGYGAGLEFSYFEKSARHELLTRLAGFPPPVPRRRLRTENERGRGRQSSSESVWVRPIVMVWDAPVIPLVRRKRLAPRGTFS